MAEVLEHDADLLVASFDEPHFVPGIVAAARADAARRARCGVPLERNAGAELLFLFGCELAFRFDQVSLRHVAARGGDGVGELTVVGKQNETFAVIIEPAHGIDAAFHAVQEIENRGRALRVAGGADHAVGLVERDVDKVLGLADQLAVDLDVVALRVGFGTEFDDGLAIDGDAAFEDERFGLAAGGDARGGEDFL